jgi:hypothetical protein
VRLNDTFLANPSLPQFPAENQRFVEDEPTSFFDLNSEVEKEN